MTQPSSCIEFILTFWSGKWWFTKAEGGKDIETHNFEHVNAHRPSTYQGFLLTGLF